MNVNALNSKVKGYAVHTLLRLVCLLGSIYLVR